MTRTRLQYERERAGLSRAAVARAAEIGNTMYGWIEARRYLPYDRQLSRIAKAIGWNGEPKQLLEDVPEDGRR